MTIRTLKVTKLAAALACGVPAIAIYLSPVAAAQDATDQVYMLRSSLEVADGAQVLSTSSDILVGRHRIGDRSLLIYDVQNGALVLERGAESVAAPLISKRRAELSFAFDYRTGELSGEAGTASVFNTWLRPIAAVSPALGSNTSWSVATDLRALGVMSAGPAPLGFKLTRSLHQVAGQTVVLIEYEIPAFQYRSPGGESLIHWARGVAVVDPDFSRMYVMGTQHRASAISAAGEMRPISVRSSMHAIEPDGGWTMDFANAPAVRGAFERLAAVSGDRVLPVEAAGEDSKPDPFPTMLASYLDMAAFAIAEGGANPVPVTAGVGSSLQILMERLGSSAGNPSATVLESLGVNPESAVDPALSRSFVDYLTNPVSGVPAGLENEANVQVYHPLLVNPDQIYGGDALFIVSGWSDTGDTTAKGPAIFSFPTSGQASGQQDLGVATNGDSSIFRSSGGDSQTSDASTAPGGLADNFKAPAGSSSFRLPTFSSSGHNGYQFSLDDLKKQAPYGSDALFILRRGSGGDDATGPLFTAFNLPIVDSTTGQSPFNTSVGDGASVFRHSDGGEPGVLAEAARKAPGSSTFRLSLFPPSSPDTSLVSFRDLLPPAPQPTSDDASAKNAAALLSAVGAILDSIRSTNSRLPAQVQPADANSLVSVPGWIDPNSPNAAEYQRLVDEMQRRLDALLTQSEDDRSAERDATSGEEGGFGDTGSFFENNAFDYSRMVGVVPTDLSRWGEWLATQNVRELERLARLIGYPNLASALADAENIIRRSEDPGYRQWAMQAPSCGGYVGCGPSYLERWWQKQANVALGDILADSRDIFSTGGFSDIGISGLNLAYLLRDHALEDGDIVRIRITQFGRVIYEGQINLTNAGELFDLMVGRGVASLEIFAVNEGYSSPNTAQITVDNVVRGEATQTYSLQTGQTATLRIEAGAKPAPSTGPSGAGQ